MIFAIIPIFQSYVLILVTIFLFLAATNIQGGWLFVIDSLLISLLIFSALYPAFQSKNLLITRKFKKNINEDETLEVEVVVENTSNKNISFVGVIEEEISKKSNKKDTKLKINADKFFISLKSKEKQSFFYKIKPELRGVYEFGKIKTISDGPFGLFRYTKKVEIKDLLYVYPNVETLNNVDFYGTRTLSYKTSTKTKNQSNASLPINIREYQRGDSQKLVHWKSTARVGKLMVKELEAEQSLGVKIFIDTEKNKSFGKGKGNNFEYIIKCSLALFKYFHNKDYDIDTVFFHNDIVTKIDQNKTDRDIYNTFTELEAIENKKIRELLKPEMLSKDSINVILFLDVESEDIDILNKLYENNFEILAIFCNNSTFDNSIKNNYKNIVSKAKFKFLELEKGRKMSDILSKV